MHIFVEIKAGIRLYSVSAVIDKIIGVDLSKSLGGRDGRSERRRRENRGAVGAERVGFGEGCPPPQPTRGSGGAS